MNCPNCQAVIEQDFGMVTCHQCAHVFFVDMDGQLQAANVDQIPETIEEVTESDYKELNEEELLDLGQAPIQEVVMEPAQHSSLAEDVSDFANSDQGALSYSLTIEKIDTGEIRKLLSEALSDDRFGWDVRELISKIENGRLLIKNIHPAKMIVLLNRIRKVPVSIQWSQSVFN